MVRCVTVEYEPRFRDLWKVPNQSHEQQEDHADGQHERQHRESEDHPNPAEAGLLQPNRFLLIAQRLSIPLHVFLLQITDLFEQVNHLVVGHGHAPGSLAGIAQEPATPALPGPSDSHPWPAQAL